MHVFEFSTGLQNRNISLVTLLKNDSITRSPGNFFSILSGFSSQTLTIHRTAVERSGPSFIALYHFYPLRNIEIFICNFACEMTITYF